MIKLTHNKARDLFPGSIETWVILVLEQRPQDYADEEEVLKHTTVWVDGTSPSPGDDSGTLVLGWRGSGKANPALTRWDKKRLEWADDPDTVEFVQLVRERR